MTFFYTYFQDMVAKLIQTFNVNVHVYNILKNICYI